MSVKLSKLSTYAVQVLIAVYQNDTDHISTHNLSDRTGVPSSTVSKVLKMLGKAGLVDSVIGAGGGYFLKRPFETLTLTDVVTAIDGQIKLTPCVDQDCKSCEEIDYCAIKGQWSVVNDAVMNALNGIKIIDLIGK